MRHALTFAAISCLMSTAALAEDTAMVFGGAEASDHHSLFGILGVATPLPGSSFGNGLVARALVNGLTYRYEGAATDIDASAFGGEVSLGYQGSDQDGWWGVYAGPGYRHTHLSPDDITSDARGGDLSLNLQAEGERAFAKDYKANINASYSAFANNDYWARLRLLYNVKSSLYAGPEFAYQGNDEYQSWQVGAALLGIQIAKDANLGLKAGVRKSENFSTAPYGGVEFGYKF